MQGYTGHQGRVNHPITAAGKGPRTFNSALNRELEPLDTAQIRGGRAISIARRRSEARRAGRNPYARFWSRYWCAGKCEYPITLYNLQYGKYLQMAHKSGWCCDYCGWVYLRKVRRMIYRGLEGRPDALFVVLTAPGRVDAESWNSEAAARFKAFIRRLRREFGCVDCRAGRPCRFGVRAQDASHLNDALENPSPHGMAKNGAEVVAPGRERCLDYFATWELQKRGHLHVNIFVRGLRFVPHSRLVSLALRTGWGRSTWVEPATKARVRYAAKKGYGGLIGYITKDVRDRHLAGHAYYFSRGWLAGDIKVSAVRACDGSVWLFGSEIEAVVELRKAGYVDPPGIGPQGRPPPDYLGGGGYVGLPVDFE